MENRKDEDVADRLSPAEVHAALAALSGPDWKRAERIAGFAAAGIPGIAGEDLLNQTLEQLLAGTRRFPRDIHPLVVLKTAMRSNASNLRKREREGPIRSKVAVAGHSADTEHTGVDYADERSPEQRVTAQTVLDAIAADLKDDGPALMVAMAWMEGIKGTEAAEVCGLSAKEYDAARNRLLRKLAPHSANRRNP